MGGNMAFEEIRSGNVENIMLWRESLSLMQDSHFFDLLQMYLGEIKTPYNKPNLIEQLSSFLRKEETKQTMISLLSKEDLELLTAIYLIPKITQKKLLKFFSTKTVSELYEHLMNLEERLLIFRTTDKETGKILFKINPHLEQSLKPFLTKEKIVNYSVEFEESDICKNQAILSPELLAAFISFVVENPDLIKADGNFKKKIDIQLKEIFPQHTNLDFFKNLLNAFINLSIFRQTDDGIVVLFQRLKDFAKLTEVEQYVYLAVAATDRYPRDIIQKESQHLIEVLMQIEGACYTKENLIKQSFLISQQKSLGESSPKSLGRFAAILKEAQNQKEGQNSFQNPDSKTFPISKLIDNALLFGLLNICKNHKTFGEGYVVAKIKQSSDAKLVNIDGGYSVSIMQGLPLRKLIPFPHCILPKAQ